MHVIHPSKDVKQAVKNTRAKFGREIRDENINFRVVNTEVNRTQPSKEQADQDKAGQSQSTVGKEGKYMRWYSEEEYRIKICLSVSQKNILF